MSCHHVNNTEDVRFKSSVAFFLLKLIRWWRHVGNSVLYDLVNSIV